MSPNLSRWHRRSSLRTHLEHASLDDLVNKLDRDRPIHIVVVVKFDLIDSLSSLQA